MLIQLETHYSKPKPRSLFYSYSHKDEGLREELDAHLNLLKRDGFISTWDDQRIRPGDQWDSEISDALNRADVILFLVSPHFLASRYCRDVEVRRAMERYRSKEALVIPIILKPVVFSSEEFAKLQALPKNCRPLIEWPDSGFAAVAEELRTLMVDLHFPQSPKGDPLGHHGSWILKLESRSNEDDYLRAKRVVSRLQGFTADYSISLQATSVTQVADGEEIKTGLMLILAGSAKGFAATEKAHKAGTLSSVLDDKVLQFYIIHGATVQGQSRPGTSADISEAEGLNLLLRLGRKMRPAQLRGINLPKGDAGSMQFFFHRGDTGFLSDAERDREYGKLLDYFKTSTAIPDGDQWVNLSAFEADRMLPKELTGTALGRVLLSQDCMLKRLTASFMHPDSTVGREYWNAVYAEARKRFGNSKMRFQSFQKVWIIPSETAVYEADGDEPQQELANDDELHRTLNKLVRDFGLAPGNKVVTILRNRLTVQCEADLIARKEVLGGTEGLPPGVRDSEPDFALNLFREIVLPKIEEEVNEGEHFTEIRQIYSAMVLATWVKHIARETDNSRVKALADSGNPDSVQMSMGSVSVLGTFGEAQVPAPNKEQYLSLRRAPPDHAEPLSPAFDVPENAEFYQVYINLFRNGVFRCTRSEAGDGPDERVIRVYFSGAIDFKEIPLRVQKASGLQLA